MDRKDSGFVESFTSQSQKSPQHTTRTTLPTTTTTPPPPPKNVHRRNTAPSRHQPGKASPKSTRNSTSVDMTKQYSASENRSRPSHHRSTTSSENSTTKSRGRHGSKPSSRRTSCTIVDPSRPSRQYRIKSSQSITTASGQDVDDVLALHFRACSLFQNPSYQSHSRTTLPSSNPSPSSSPSTHAASFTLHQRPSTAHDAIVPESTTIPPTTTHWTSSTTRQRDYARIDRANTGFRGLLRRILPRCVSGPHEKLYEKDADASDAGSVRRYRMDDVVEEKKLVAGGTRKKRAWSCF